MPSTRVPFKLNSLHDRNATLCLACACSLPPLKAGSTDSKIHITECCQSPICPSCISKNPRLARYNPCLSCLGGVGVVASGSGSGAAASMKTSMSPRTNIDGAVRHEDTFVLGDDEDEDEEEDKGEPPMGGKYSEADASPPAYEAAPAVASTVVEVQPAVTAEESPPPSGDVEGTKTTPYKYYLGRADTLQGVSLRFGVDRHEICRMNNLPPSVIRTTPHLLHTRAFILLPPTAKPHLSLTLSEADQTEREEKIVRERAEKKLQKLTKEVDWRVAKAYVAMADDAHDQALLAFKHKEMGINRSHIGLDSSGVSRSHGGRDSSRSGLEALAVQKYLDDEEWEAEELRAGRGVQVQQFPYGAFEKDNKLKGVQSTPSLAATEVVLRAVRKQLLESRR
ncbi:hypothetical protein NLJ89_g11475 [Agrocybe chaxingu]|uniref:LysM domain-containing protein n=1 Tax=Agrocybe chaxingu TaxID=84603 RepID=A0A9W8JW81_9AGAR|nr:hypothetical protein NLJ89_g11475 [Agrocybe chaxingu]